MKTIDCTGLSPEMTTYTENLERQVEQKSTQLQEQSKTVETLQVRVDKLTQMLHGLQKSMFGQSSEKRRYVLGEDQLSFLMRQRLKPIRRHRSRIKSP